MPGSKNKKFNCVYALWRKFKTPDKLALVLIFFALTLSHAGNTQTLESLTPAQHQAAVRLCVPIRFHQGSDAYRDCVINQIELASNGIDLQFAAMSDLPIDEQYAIQRACTDAGALHSPQYLRCADKQLLELEAQPQPNLDTLPKHEQLVVARQCSSPKGGIGDYRICANAATASLSSLAQLNIGNRSSSESRDIKLSCSLESTDVSTYRQCVLDAHDISFDPKHNITVTAVTPQLTRNTLDVASIGKLEGLPLGKSNNASTPPIDKTIASSQEQDKPDYSIITAMRALDSQRNLANADQENEILATNDKGSSVPAPLSSSESSSHLKGDSNVRFKYSLAALETDNRVQTDNSGSSSKPIDLKHWFIFASLLTVSLLFLGLLVKNRSSSERHVPAQSTAASVTAMPQQQVIPQTPTRPNVAPVHSTDSTYSPDHDTTQTPRVSDVRTERQTSVAKHIEHSEHTTDNNNLPSSVETASRPQQTHAENKFVFSSWILTIPEDHRLELSIELLIHWIAYADNRFKPDTESRLFGVENPNSQNIVKRLAFSQDALALSGAITYLQKNAQPKQLEQTINLIFALLVNEKALSPVVNNLLRFLADAFGIGQTRLQTMFQDAFNHDMPAIPRPDKSLWWQFIDDEMLLRWDIQALATQAEDVRFRATLGLPLSGALDQQALVSSYRRALDRCQATRVDQLGNMARALVIMESDKYGLAFDSLWDFVA